MTDVIPEILCAKETGNNKLNREPVRIFSKTRNFMPLFHKRNFFLRKKNTFLRPFNLKIVTVTVVDKRMFLKEVFLYFQCMCVFLPNYVLPLPVTF